MPVRRTLHVLLALFVLALALLSACADDAEDATETDASSPADEAPAAEDEAVDEDATDAQNAGPGDGPGLQVSATLAPLGDVVEQVLGDRGQVQLLVPPGADAHTYEPRPGDVAPLAEADIAFANGLGLNDAAVNLAEANLPEGAPLVLLGEVALSRDDLRHDHWHDHGDESHSHGGDGHTHDDNGHTHNGHTHDDNASSDDDNVNPHVWTSAANIQAFVDTVADELSAVDPDGAEEYRARADEYIDELQALRDAIDEAVLTIPEEDRKLVVYHDAWTYFGDEHGVEVIAAVQPSDFSEPSAADIRAIIDQLREEQVPALFGSAEFSSDIVETIAEETDAEYVGDLADDILPGEAGDPEHSYVGMMAVNVRKIVDALGGDSSALDPFPG